MNLISRILDQSNLYICLIVLLSLAALVLILVMIWHWYKKRNYAEALNKTIIIRLANHWIIYAAVLFFFILLNLSAMAILSPDITSPSGPSKESVIVSANQPLVVEFDRPVSKSISYEIAPNLPGEWDIENSLLLNRSKLIFTPDVTPELDTRYTVSLKNIRNYFGFKSKEYLFSFQTPREPEVVETSILDGAINVMPDVEIIIKTDPIIENSANLFFEITPQIELIVAQSDNEYRIRAKDRFAKSTTYNLKVYRNLVRFSYKLGIVINETGKSEILSLNFRSVDAPGIKSASPSGSGVLVDSNIIIEFNQPMDRESVQKAFSAKPKIDGKYSWDGDMKLIFNPDKDLIKNSKYSVGISKKAKATDGSNIEEEIGFEFVTIGYVQVSSFYPSSGAREVSKSTKITVTFNQEVDRGSAESRFSITPTVSGSFSWSGNTLYFSHDQLADYQSYTVKIDSGVKTIYGLDSKDAFSSSFVTKIPKFELNVSAYRQAHMYTCMSSAARSAMAYKGVSLSEDTISSKIGYDSTPWSGTWSEGGAVWGDPDVGIVGDINGKADDIGWGYGSHWNPVASAINSFGVGAEVKSGWSVAGIASEIAKGNPVIIWWVNGVWPAYEVNWKTPGGKSVRGVNSMHVQVVKGFTGTVDNPQSFVVTDSGYGYPGRSYDVGTFKAKWSWFGNTAVVVK
jgi:uncharacterized protein YvpB